MTDIIFFDTDCLSAFLWVKAEHFHLYDSELEEDNDAPEVGGKRA